MAEWFKEKKQASRRQPSQGRELKEYLESWCFCFVAFSLLRVRSRESTGPKWDCYI